MKNKFILLPLFLVCLFISEGWAQTENEQNLVKVLSYNIYHGENEDGEIEINNAARVINSNLPDIVALQEVDRNTTRVNGRDLVIELAGLTQMLPLFGRSIDYSGGEYGVAILSKHRIVKSQVYKLPFEEGTEPRIALEALIQIPSGDTVRFICTHLSVKSEALTVAQVDFINNQFNDQFPTILAGDMNVKPDSKTVGILKTEWRESLGATEFTFPSAKPVKKLDYIFSRPVKRWSVVHSKVIDEKKSSDHCPVIATLSLKSK